MIDRVRQQVSLCMIVRDEAHNLAACVQLLRPMLSEIIVVDTGSTDGTQQIARELGAKVVEFEWIDDFSAARNEALRHATGDYILWVDADDRLDAAQAAKLHELIRGLDGTRQAFILDVFCKTPNATQPGPTEYQPRLFRADPRVRWQYRVHEQLMPCLQQLGYAFGWPGIRIDHEGYVDPEVVREKSARNLRMGRVQYAVAPDDPAVLYHLGQEFVRLGNSNEALGYLFKSLQFANPKDSWVARVYVETVAALSRVGRKPEALQLARQGLGHFGSCAQLLLAEVELLCEQGDTAEARPTLLRLAEISTSQPFGLNMPIEAIRNRALNLLGVTDFQMQRYEPAENRFRQALAEDPTNVQAWTWLGYVHVARGNMLALTETVQRLRQLPTGEPFALCLEAEALKNRWLLNEALANARCAATLAPAMPLARMLIAELLLSIGASAEQLRTALLEVLQVAPGNIPALRELERLNRAPAAMQNQFVNTVIVGEDCRMHD